MPSNQKCGTGYRCRCRYARSLSASWKAWTRSWVKRTSAWQSTVPPRLLGGAPRSRNPAGSAQKTALAAADDWQALNLSSEAWKPVIQRCRGWQKHAGRAVGDWGERAGLNCTRRGCLRGAESEAQGEAPCGEAAEATAARREGKAPSCGLAGPAQRRLEVRSWRSWQGLPDLLPEAAVSIPAEGVPSFPAHLSGLFLPCIDGLSRGARHGMALGCNCEGDLARVSHGVLPFRCRL